MVPPIVPSPKVFNTDAHLIAHDLALKLRLDVLEAQDNLLHAKVDQTVQANKQCLPDFCFNIGSWLYLSTKNRIREYLNKDKRHVTKFAVKFDSPYTIIDKDEVHSTYTLDLPSHSNIYPVFHVSELQPCYENDNDLFLLCAQKHSYGKQSKDGKEVFRIERIIDQC